MTPRKFAAVWIAVIATCNSGCVGTLPADATPTQVARRECLDWLQRVGFARGLRSGTKAWHDALKVCTAQHTPWVQADAE